MCLLALFYRVVEDAPVVVGANREEFYRRGGEAAAASTTGRRASSAASIRWPAAPGSASTSTASSRPSPTAARTAGPDRPRSRGLLVRDLLACATAADAGKLAVEELNADRYDGCNIVCADAAQRGADPRHATGCASGRCRRDCTS